MLSAFLADPPPNYAERRARRRPGSICLSGRLEHREVGRLVPACDALVFPSTHPEAFGMVAAEAASAGVLPVSAAHSGALEVSRALMDGLPDEAAGLVSFPLGEGAIEAIAARLNVWLGLDPHAQRERPACRLRDTAKRLWGWEGVAREVIAAAKVPIDSADRRLTPLALNRMPRGDPGHLYEADRTDARPHGRAVRDHVDPRLERHAGLGRGGRDRPASGRDDRALARSSSRS